jgi:hypothetical protein
MDWKLLHVHLPEVCKVSKKKMAQIIDRTMQMRNQSVLVPAPQRLIRPTSGGLLLTLLCQRKDIISQPHLPALFVRVGVEKKARKKGLLTKIQIRFLSSIERNCGDCVENVFKCWVYNNMKKRVTESPKSKILLVDLCLQNTFAKL